MLHRNPLSGIPFIALVGNPKAGKSLVQELLMENYGVRKIDSGLPLRRIAIEHYGLTEDQVFTQAGKLEYVEILGRRWQVRELLGELGNRFEEMHGDWATPWMVTRIISDLDSHTYCDAACRKNQGAFYKSKGGIVIGIRRPDIAPSPYEFDRVREEYVDLWIENDGFHRGLNAVLALRDLRTKIDRAVQQALKLKYVK